jgi:hypothetical protein
MCIFIGKNEFFHRGNDFCNVHLLSEKTAFILLFIGEKSASGAISEGNSGCDHLVYEEK